MIFFCVYSYFLFVTVIGSPVNKKHNGCYPVVDPDASDGSLIPSVQQVNEASSLETEWDHVRPDDDFSEISSESENFPHINRKFLPLFFQIELEDETDCFFRKKRKTKWEKVERSLYSKVSTECDGPLERLVWILFEI